MVEAIRTVTRKKYKHMGKLITLVSVFLLVVGMIIGAELDYLLYAK